jgi:hypothetical protein
LVLILDDKSTVVMLLESFIYNREFTVFTSSVYKSSLI